MAVRAKIEKAINQGAPVKADVEKNELRKVNIKMPPRMWDDLKEMAKDMIGNTRTSIILQATDKALKEWKRNKE